MATPILKIPQIAPTQADKTTTINDMLLAVENATQATMVVNFAAGDVTLTGTQLVSAATFVCTGAAAPRTLIIPLQARVFTVDNTAGGFTVTVRGPTGAAVSMLAGWVMPILCDGTNCRTTSVAAGTSLTQVVAGAGLNGGTITTVGTIALAALAPGALLGNSGTISATPAAVTLGTGLALSAGAIVPTGQAGPYIVASFSSATVFLTSQILLGHRFAAAVTFPANFGASAQGPASSGGSFVAATASTVISVDQCTSAADPTNPANWTTIGTMTFGAAGHSITFATTSGAAKAFAAGDYMRWVAPVVPDATLVSVFASLVAARN